MGNVSELQRPLRFTIDGRPYSTTDHKQLAGDLLRLAGLNPEQFDLGELRGHRPDPVRYTADTVVEIHDGARFVGIRHRADVA
jgi:hypothetical protein